MMQLILAVIFAASAVLNPNPTPSDYQALDSAIMQLHIAIAGNVQGSNLPVATSSVVQDVPPTVQNQVIAPQIVQQTRLDWGGVPDLTVNGTGIDVSWSANQTATAQFYLCSHGSKKQTDFVLDKSCTLNYQGSGTDFAFRTEKYSSPMFYAIVINANGESQLVKGQLPQ